MRGSGWNGLAWRLSAVGVVLLLTGASVTAQGGGRAIAVVNGSPISEEKMVEVLMEARGLEILQQLVVLELAKQETSRRGLTVTQRDVDQEFEDALDRIARSAGLEPAQSTRENKLEALETLLGEKRISMAEFRVSMERNAHLRKVVESEVTIDDATLREEFARTQGAKVQVRHIQFNLGDTQLINQARAELNRGVPFEEVARRFSQNPETAARGGLLEPFTFTDTAMDPALRDRAFSLKVGEVDPAVLRVGNRLHILKLERRIPPDDVRFEDVREEVARSMRDRVIPQQMEKIAVELFEKANVRVLDPELRARYQSFLEDRAKGGAGAP